MFGGFIQNRKEFANRTLLENCLVAEYRTQVSQIYLYSKKKFRIAVMKFLKANFFIMKRLKSTNTRHLK